MIKMSTQIFYLGILFHDSSKILYHDDVKVEKGESDG